MLLHQRTAERDRGSSADEAFRVGRELRNCRQMAIATYCDVHNIKKT